MVLQLQSNYKEFKSMRRELKEIASFFQFSKFDKPSVLNCMINFRLVLEENKLKEKYKFLNLYCNWMVHQNITNSMTAIRILDYLTDSMIDHNKNTNSATHIHDAIIEGLNLHSVQSDILKFGQEFNINVNVIKYKENWQNFAYFILYTLIDRSLKFSENPLKIKSKEIYNSIKKKAIES